MPKDTFARSRHRCRPAHNTYSEMRLLCSDLIKVRWVDRQGTQREEIAVLESYSISRAGLFMGVSIGESTPVTLCGGEEEFRAIVRHCVPAPNGYLAWVDFWDRPQSYLPEHLLDPSRLISAKRP